MQQPRLTLSWKICASRLHIHSAPITAPDASIICNIGPTFLSVEMIEKMIKSRMNVARLNCSHGTHEYHAETIRNAREAMESFSSDSTLHRPAAVALDSQGPGCCGGLLQVLQRCSASGQVPLSCSYLCCDSQSPGLARPICTMASSLCCVRMQGRMPGPRMLTFV